MFLVKHVDLQKMQNEQDAPENTKLEKRPIIPLRIRNLPGDLLSNREFKFYIYIYIL